MASSSVILDSRGQPMRRAVLTEEIAGPSVSGVRSVVSGHPAHGLTPLKLAALLREAENGNALAYFELAEEMEEKDLHYLSVMGTRKRAVSQLPITVEPADDSAEAKADAQLIEDWLDRDTLETEMFDILDAVGKGVSYTEIIWDQGDLWLPRALKWRMPQWFEFDRIDGETPLLRDAGGQLVPLEYGKFISHVHPAKTGLPVRGGLARAVAWGWMFKNFGVKDWISFLEAYGKPVRVGRFDPGAAEGDIRKLMRAVAQVGSDAAAVYPRTMDIEFIDAKAGTAPNELWKSLALYIDDQVSKAVVGQTSSADAKATGIGSGQSDLHGEVRDDIARADGKLLAATLNRDLVRPMIELNRGMRKKYPRIKIAKPDEVDVKSMMEAARTFVDMGGEVDADEVRERAGLPAPKSADAKLLSPTLKNLAVEAPDAAGGSVPPEKATTNRLGPLKTAQRGNRGGGATPAAASAGAVTATPDPIDDLSDELLGDWDSIFEEMVAPVEAAIASAATPEAARDALAAQLATMPVDAFVTMMERAGFATMLAAEVDAAADEVR